MREIQTTGSVRSLEDLIKTHSQKPTKEMMDGVSAARGLMREIKVSELLGINSLDSMLFHAYLSERVIRTRLYDLDWIMHSPEFDFSQKEIERDEKTRQKLKDSMDNLVLREKDLVEQYYSDSRSRILARKLELSANDLVGKSSVYDDQKFETRIEVSDDVFEVWANRWQTEFRKKTGHAREKHLLYLDR